MSCLDMMSDLFVWPLKNTLGSSPCNESISMSIYPKTHHQVSVNYHSISPQTVNAFLVYISFLILNIKQFFCLSLIICAYKSYKKYKWLVLFMFFQKAVISKRFFLFFYMCWCNYFHWRERLLWALALLLYVLMLPASMNWLRDSI